MTDRISDTRPSARRDARRGLHLAIGALLLPIASGCSVVTRIDYLHLLSRRGWQRTDLVIDTLTIRAGDRIADLGAGEGYFSFHLADAVGPTGRVYAIDIDAEKLAGLRDRAAKRSYANIEVIQATADDAGLPEAGVDLVFLCNAYHHFDDRVAYFTALHAALAPGARIAVLDGKSEGVASWVVPHGHWLPPGELVRELEAAGYRHLASYDALPFNTFDVFAADGLETRPAPNASDPAGCRTAHRARQAPRSASQPAMRSATAGRAVAGVTR